MKPYLTNITPDSLSGKIFAAEGIRRGVVLLNGPTGCKFYHGALSEEQGLRQPGFDPLSSPELWFFGQHRVPCTYLDKRDYIYGSREKLTELLTYIKEKLPADCVIIINSPGAALIGDALDEIAGAALGDFPFLTIQTPGFSRPVWEGYASASCDIIRRFVRPGPAAAERRRKRVNLLGLSVFQKYYKGDLAELRRLLRLCGLELNCALCCGSTLEEIRRLPEAELNIVLRPEYGLGAAELLREEWGMPYLLCEGLPVGFSATEKLFRELSERLGGDFGALREESERARAEAWLAIYRLNYLSGLPKGVPFSVQGSASECLGYCRFLIRYLGMRAESVSLLEEGGQGFESLRRLLRSHGMEAALERDILAADAQLVLADANIIAKLSAGHKRFSGIEISLPSFGYIDVTPKTHLGIRGSLLLTEQLLNGLPFCAG